MRGGENLDYVGAWIEGSNRLRFARRRVSSCSTTCVLIIAGLISTLDRVQTGVIDETDMLTDLSLLTLHNAVTQLRELREGELCPAT